MFQHLSITRERLFYSMGFDIYIIKKKTQECLIHWHDCYPLVDWFKRKVYNDKLDTEEHDLDFLALVFLQTTCQQALQSADWKKLMSEQLFPISEDFKWTGTRELAYLKLMDMIATDIENLGESVENEELCIRIRR